MNVNDKHYREKVYEIVRQIPSGRVMTYGQIANLLSKNYTARTVGFVMHAAETENVPWQRVINSKGSCSTAKLLVPFNIQQKLLEDEGVKFHASGCCDLRMYRWLPETDDLQANEQPNLYE
jgi:methylated-DNA-protein-cysteine methyltransferase related protein